MKSAILLIALIFGVNSIPVNLPEAVITNNADNLGMAVDFYQPATTSQFSCLRTNGYQAVFMRAYDPSGEGAFDLNVVQNINNAYAAGIGAELYMPPSPKSKKTGSAQFDEVYNALTARGITLRSIWIQVTNQYAWHTSTSTNTNLINSIISRAKHFGLTVGIYTNNYDWTQITGSYKSLSSDIMLWYWEILGYGPSAESPSNYNDFRAFGKWTQPTVKQFAQVENVCTINNLNRNVFTIASKTGAAASEGIARREMSDTIVVGHIGL